MDDLTDTTTFRLTRKGKRWMKFCEKHRLDPGAAGEDDSDEMRLFMKAEAKRKANPNKIPKKKKKPKAVVGFHHPSPTME